ncbi:MAG: S1 family peptidase, partial [Chloroflexales bacterium]|nr:S1 family peptidase [Chloroflexales bacterium]
MMNINRRLWFTALLVILSLVGFTASTTLGANIEKDMYAQQDDERQLLAEVEFRKSIGFRSDIDYVRQVHAQPDAVTFEAMNATFTPAEAEELRIRLALEQDGETLQQYFRDDSDVRDAFGGIYLDHDTGGELVLQIVRTHSLTDQIHSLIPPLRHVDRLRIDYVEWSNLHLEQQFEAITDRMMEFPDIQAVSIDREENRIAVMIAPQNASTATNELLDKETLRLDLATLLADPAIVVTEGMIRIDTEGTGTEGAGTEEAMQIQSLPVMAGKGWRFGSDSGHICTLGFEVIDRRRPAILTAGHCVETAGWGWWTYNFDTHFGEYSGRYQNGSYDNSGIAIDVGIHYLNDAGSATDDIYQGGNPTLDVIGAVGDYSYTNGYIRCFHGISSGTLCGPITEGTIDAQDSKTGIYYRDMFWIDPVGLGGDSGAPMYRTQAGNTAEAAGIVMANVLDDYGNPKDLA